MASDGGAGVPGLQLRTSRDRSTTSSIYSRTSDAVQSLSGEPLDDMSFERFLENMAAADAILPAQPWSAAEVSINMSARQPREVGTGGGKRAGAAGKDVDERRLKRMIKNRESAMRSRERKQAYIKELEDEIMRLEEENEKLRNHKESEEIVGHAPQPDRRQLRRASSATF